MAAFLDVPSSHESLNPLQEYEPVGNNHIKCRFIKNQTETLHEPKFMITVIHFNLARHIDGMSSLQMAPKLVV